MILAEGVSRSPVFVFLSVIKAARCALRVSEQEEAFAAVTQSTTNHGRFDRLRVNIGETISSSSSPLPLAMRLVKIWQPLPLMLFVGISWCPIPYKPNAGMTKNASGDKSNGHESSECPWAQSLRRSNAQIRTH